jgi:hypothetical protein
MRWRMRPSRTGASDPPAIDGPEERPAIDLRLPIEEAALPPPQEPVANGASRRSLPGWVLLALLLGLVGGGVGLLVAAAIGLVTAFLAPRPRVFLRWAVALLVVVPLTVLVRKLPPAFFVSPDFVHRNLLAHYLAGTALVLLIVGILREVGTAAPGPPVAVPVLEVDEEPVARRRLPWPRVSAFAAGLGLLTVAGLMLRLAVSSTAASDPVSGQIAANLVGGAGYSLPGPFGALAPTALRVPITPALLALAQTSASPELAARLLWAVIGAGTVTAVGVVGRRMFGVTAGLVAAAIVAVVPSFFLENVRLESGTVAALVIALLLVALTGPTGPVFTPLRAAVAGGLAGILALTRPEGLLLGLAIVAAWLVGRAASTLSPARRATLAVVAVAGFAVVAGPWMARNHGAVGTYLPTTEVGTVAAGANAGSTYTGGLVGSYDPSAAAAAVRSASTTPVGEGLLNRRLRSEAESYAAGHAGGLLIALPIRVARAFDLWNPVNERDAHATRGLAVKGWLLEWLSFLPLLALAAWGYWRLRRRFLGDLLPLYVAPPAVALVALVAYGEPLARAAIDPVLALVAGAGLTMLPGLPRWGRSPRQRRHRGHGRRRGLIRRRHSAV